MPKKSPARKTPVAVKKPAAKSVVKTSARKTAGKAADKSPKAAKPAKVVIDPEALTAAKAREKLDAAKPKATPARDIKAGASHPQRNPNFPKTYIKQINVSLTDPDHAMTFVWTGPDAASQETGPFHTAPGAGLKGLNCDNVATSQRSGSCCTPKGTYFVQGFQSRLNSDARATFVTWFLQRRGIAFHYFPTVPNYAASHGCVRVAEKRVAQMIQDNARVDLTKVVIDGTWTKPAKQW